MIIRGFKMKIKAGMGEVYKKRHAKIWPEMKQALEDSGIVDYVIFYEEETGLLFAYQNLENDNTAHNLKHNPIMQHWWNSMADIMIVNPDKSPVVSELKIVYSLSNTQL